MRSILLTVIGIFTFGLGSINLMAQSTNPALPPSDSEKPFWSGETMTDDPLLFIQKEGESLATAKLLFPATSDLRLTNMDGTQIYELNRDYTWKQGSDLLTLTAHSRIPFKTQQEMFPPVGAPYSFGKTVNGQTGVLFAEGPFFYNLHALASYTHAGGWSGAIPPGPSSALGRTRVILQGHQPLKIVLLGDSISKGANSSSFIGTPPLRPNFLARLVANLQIRFGATISLVNLSVVGKTSAWGLSRADKVIAEKPDVVLLGFGMNDREPAPQYATNMKTLIQKIQAGRPAADIVLIASMTGNPDLADFPQTRFEQYRDALNGLQGPGVAVADITSIWIDLLKQKSFADLTGNGVNHPNDFGHAVYASVLESLF